MPNLTSTYCYYPRENPTWTENLRDLLDGSGTYQIHWLATDVTLPESVELIAGFGKQLTAQVRPVDDPNLALTWTSSDEAVATVAQDGTVTAVAPGTAEKVAEVEAALKDGTLHVFDCSTFTVDGETLTVTGIDRC